MRAIILLGLVVAIVIVVGGLWWIQRSPKQNIPIPTQAQRVAVEVKRGGGVVTFAGETLSLTSGLEIGNGAVIKTNHEGIVVLRFDDDSWVTIDSDTTATIVTLGSAKSFSLSLGRLSVRLGRLLGRGEQFDVKTPNSVTAVRGTRFGVAYARGQTKVVVLESQVKVTPLDWRTGEVVVNTPALIVGEQQRVIIEDTALLAGQPAQVEAASQPELIFWRSLLEQQPAIKPQSELPADDQAENTKIEQIEPANLTPTVTTPAEPVASPVRLIAGINFVQTGPIVLTPGQKLSLQLEQVSGSGKKTAISPSMFEWFVEGDPGIGEVDLSGVLTAGPYGGVGTVTAVKTDQEQVVFERSIKIEVKGAKAPSGFQQE